MSFILLSILLVLRSRFFCYPISSVPVLSSAVSNMLLNPIYWVLILTTTFLSSKISIWLLSIYIPVLLKKFFLFPFISLITLITTILNLCLITVIIWNTSEYLSIIFSSWPYFLDPSNFRLNANHCAWRGVEAPDEVTFLQEGFSLWSGRQLEYGQFISTQSGTESRLSCNKVCSTLTYPPHKGLNWNSRAFTRCLLLVTQILISSFYLHNNLRLLKIPLCTPATFLAFIDVHFMD